MFCPNCGSSDQSKNTYCRQYGIFLPDFDNRKAEQTSLTGMLRTNNMINGLTAISSLVLAVLLFFGFPAERTGPLLAVTIGFLIGITIWQWQSALRNEKILNQLERRDSAVDEFKPSVGENISGAPTNKLGEANFEDAVPPQVTENTTKDLNKISRQ